MDDARNGLRGLRAAPSEKLYDLLRGRYGLDPTEEPRDLGGSSSLNLLIAAGGQRCVARVYRPYVTAARLDAIQSAKRALARGGVPCAEPVLTPDGEPWAVLDGRLTEVERFVEFDAEMDSWERLEVGLPWLGRIHALLRTVKVGPEGKAPLFANHVEPLDALPWTLRGTKRIRGWRPSPGELQLADAVEELARRVADAERGLVASLPRQLVHGDFWDNNVGFCDGRVALITDFDFMGERARIDDLALTLFFASMQYQEAPVSDDQLQRLARLVEAYDSGLDMPLSSLERAALPAAIARQPLWSIGGWVATLDDEQAARRHAAGSVAEVDWALRLMEDLGRWQEAFALAGFAVDSR
jgi:homoserine kinase type II